MIMAVLSGRVGTIVVVMLFRSLIAMIVGFLLAVILGAVLRADGNGDHGGEGESRHGEYKRLPRVLMHGQSSTDCFEEPAV